MTAQTSSFQWYQNYQKRTSRKKVTRQTMNNIFPKIPNATNAYNVLMPTKSDLDGPGKIKIFENGVKVGRRYVSTCTIPNIRSVAALSEKRGT